MDKHRSSERRNRIPKLTAPVARQSRPRTYEQPDLDAIPLNPKRSGYVLQLILQQHNWQHSSKPKGVSNKTMAERTRFCCWLFGFLRSHPKHFKLDPRSFSGRHVEAVTQYWQDEARAGRMSPATIQTYFSFLKTFAGWIGKPKLLKPLQCYFDDPKLYQRRQWPTSCPRRAPLGDGSAQLPAVEPLKTRPAGLGRARPVTNVEAAVYSQSTVYDGYLTDTGRPRRKVPPSAQADQQKYALTARMAAY